MPTFEDIIKELRANPALTTYLALANKLLGAGTPSNASRIGQIINQHKIYFEWTNQAAFKPNWEVINKGFPTTQPDFVTSLLNALDVEAFAVQMFYNYQNPIKIASIRRDGLYYEAVLEGADDESDERDFSLQDGIDIEFKWTNTIKETGELLAFDPLRSRLIVKFDKPLSSISRRNSFCIGFQYIFKHPFSQGSGSP